jgi:hypothetical protein
MDLIARPRLVRVGMSLIVVMAAAACASTFGGSTATPTPAETTAAAASPAASSAAPTAASAARTARVSANTATEAEIAAALAAAGVPNADRWAREVTEYRPYPADDPTLQKLQQNLAKYNPDPGTLAGILSALAP